MDTFGVIARGAVFDWEASAPSSASAPPVDGWWLVTRARIFSWGGVQQGGGAPSTSGSLAASEAGADAAALSGAVSVRGTLAASESGSDAALITSQIIIRGTLAGGEAGADVAAMQGAGAIGIVTGFLAALETDVDAAAIRAPQPYSAPPAGRRTQGAARSNVQAAVRRPNLSRGTR